MANILAFREEGDVVVVDVTGTLTGENSALLRDLLQELAEAGYKNVLLNMAGITRIDMAGILQLVAGYASLARVNGTLKLLSPRKPVKCVLRIAKLDSVFEQYEQEHAAVLSFISPTRKELEAISQGRLPSDAYLG
jgi:anti-sigma B factor antagonist